MNHRAKGAAPMAICGWQPCITTARHRGCGGCIPGYRGAPV